MDNVSHLPTESTDEIATPAPARMDETTNHADDIPVTRITISQPSDREPIEQYGSQEGTNRSASLTRHRSIPTMCSNFVDPTSHSCSTSRRIWGVGPRIQRLGTPFVTEPLRWGDSNGGDPPGFECVDWHLQCPGSTGDNKTESADWDATTRIAALEPDRSPWLSRDPTAHYDWVLRLNSGWIRNDLE